MCASGIDAHHRRTVAVAQTQSGVEAQAGDRSLLETKKMADDLFDCRRMTEYWEVDAGDTFDSERAGMHSEPICLRARFVGRQARTDESRGDSEVVDFRAVCWERVYDFFAAG